MACLDCAMQQALIAMQCEKYNGFNNKSTRNNSDKPLWLSVLAYLYCALRYIVNILRWSQKMIYKKKNYSGYDSPLKLSRLISCCTEQVLLMPAMSKVAAKRALVKKKCVLCQWWLQWCTQHTFGILNYIVERTINKCKEACSLVFCRLSWHNLVKRFICKVTFN